MEVRTKCPASCGELLQGIIGNGEKLISYPIDLFTTITLKEVKDPERKRNKKCISAIYKTLEYFKENPSIANSLEIKVESNIPIAKGMASSTADIAATIVAVSILLGKKISDEELAKICTHIEPTDSTIFEKLTLFDHLKGNIIENFDWNPSLDIFLLESSERLNTQIFRKQNYDYLRKINKNKVEKAYEVFKEAYKKKDYRLLGEAATMSALANQIILKKDKLEEVINISLKEGCYGVNVAHSGTVMGIIFEKNKIDYDKLVKSLKDHSVDRYYEKMYLTKMVKGGVRVI
ncbi:propanediol utilization protein [Lutibacter sp. B2]|nr:propanediol utilization protein [Lutibacter sp. B2]